MSLVRAPFENFCVVHTRGDGGPNQNSGGMNEVGWGWESWKSIQEVESRGLTIDGVLMGECQGSGKGQVDSGIG